MEANGQVIDSRARATMIRSLAANSMVVTAGDQHES